MPKGNSALYILAEADTEAIRTDTFMGQDHLVVPVVALVEGVVRPSNSPIAELALASEFAHHPEGWNGRPIVLDHPVVNGLKVSANQPIVLQEESFGMLFNTTLDEGKLKQEMWINLERVDELGDDVKEAVQALQDGEITEVSTGLFTDVEMRKGTFNGKAFDGIWRNVTPDHLAILPPGLTGACSVEDGCGAPRVNSAGEPTSCGPDCTCFTSKERDMAKHDPEEDEEAKKKKAGATKQNSAGGDVIDDPPPSITPNTEGGFRTFVTKFLGLISFKSGDEEVALRTNKELSDRDTKTSLLIALEKEGETEFPFIIALFSTSFVYEPDFSGKLLKRDFTLDNKGNATLGKKVTEVRPITEFVAASQHEEGDTTMPDAKITQKVDALVANERTNFDDDHKDWLATLNMSQLEALEPKAPEKASPTEVEKKAAEVAANAAAEEAKKKAAATSKGTEAPTTEQFLAAAPAEIAEVLNEGVSLRNQRRDDLVKGLQANERCTYTEDELKGMSLGGLEKLAKIANIPDYGGQGGGLRTHAEDPNAVPDAPNVFVLPERKSA
jgi:hypothetical protein